MRMKRLLSLVLAFAMLASLTISASPDAVSRVYYVQDFDYTGMEAFLADANYYPLASREGAATTITTVNKTLTNGDINSGYALTAYDNFAGIPVLKAKTNKMTLITEAEMNRGTTNTLDSTSKIATNSNGDKAFFPWSETTITSNQKWYTANLVFMPTESWDSTGKDEAYVISYDVEKVTDEATAEQAHLYDRIFTSTAADGTTKYARSNVFQKSKAGVLGRDTVMADGKVYNVTLTFTPDDTGLAFASYVDGVKDNTVTANNYANANGSVVTRPSTDGTYASYTWTAANKIVGTKIEGFSIGFSYLHRRSFADVKSYTVSTAPYAFAVESAPTTGATGVKTSDTKVTVKFTQPVGSLDKAAVKVYKNDVEMTGGYEVGDPKEVVGAVGGEIYSTVDVDFTSLDAASVYKIEFPTTTANIVGNHLTMVEAATEEGAEDTVYAANNVATFATEVTDLVISNFNVVTAFGTDAETRTPDGSFTAGTLQGAAIDIRNTTAAEKNIAVIYAVYSGTQLADVVYANAAIGSGKTSTVEAGLTPSNAGTVKVFVWDFAALKPYTDATTKTVAAQ